MIELLLFAFGFGMGAMVLYFISSKREKKLKSEKEALISENEKLNADIKHLKDRLSFYTYNLVGDTREFSIRENYESFDVVLRILKIVPYREENIPIKRFYFKDDIEYAKLCAQELLNELNNTN
jgi:predicted alpha/beta-fold hydrolase